MATTRRAAKPAASLSSSKTEPMASTSASTPRNSPFIPTPVERLCLAVFPVALVFGTVFSVLSPDTRSAHYDAISQSHSQDPAVAPSYFAQKSNIFNVFFVKRGWAWITVAFVAFLFTHPSTAAGPRRVQAGLRWAAVTSLWFLVTQWCFGAPIIDRGFRWTGGRCELAQREVQMGDTSIGELMTGLACKAAGGKWKGGHDISGHVFLLSLGTVFLMQEVGWSVARWSALQAEERSVVMTDGALKSANVEAEESAGQGAGKSDLGLGTKFALGVMGLSIWMLLMTAIYFHTWFEKFTGLLTATTAYYIVYMLPRFIPSVRQVIGLPGI
ncbi:inositol phospholipid synthesis and fat-storage-inducing TM-domain-containing protein [Dactylonectria estremocensis]|uniref:Acyl-coenzyme A diphosphatase SCS3 n=1 Tax=Dactylonectria estremocensis TaxID=1079267 RepID=A0A9P9FHJ4_9HYPO|nr:inositol phospholipid synthesis and fat-storage-inducing TM-domain-containing protein [Dactylonectria estremocensis]